MRSTYELVLGKGSLKRESFEASASLNKNADFAMHNQCSLL